MNCIPAPCQSPDRNMVNIVGMTSSDKNAPAVVLVPDINGRFFAVRRRLIASSTGLKVYAVRNRVRLACQRTQKSMTLDALSGELKFIGSLMPKNRARPSAMSVYPEK